MVRPLGGMRSPTRLQPQALVSAPSPEFRTDQSSSSIRRPPLRSRTGPLQRSCKCRGSAAQTSRRPPSTRPSLGAAFIRWQGRDAAYRASWGQSSQPTRIRHRTWGASLFVRCRSGWAPRSRRPPGIRPVAGGLRQLTCYGSTVRMLHLWSRRSCVAGSTGVASASPGATSKNVPTTVIVSVPWLNAVCTGPGSRNAVPAG